MDGKRLVVCCDGTWKRSDDNQISNIEKIARAVETQAADGRTQFVYYSKGVGTGATWVERALGGAFGLGLDESLVEAYRFLALNYEPGDEIFVFGFSRGAYTARSLVGMIGTVGLLTPDGLVGKEDPNTNRLHEALELYRGCKNEEKQAEIAAFKRWTYSVTDDPQHISPRIAFLGVFDTVGAMGVPGLSQGRYKFHNVSLSPLVDVARQALAIDERRLTFQPCLWTKDAAKPNNTTDVEQVWFEGVHSDIGGGYERSAPAELTLAWMVDEAAKRGLDFAYERFPAGQRVDDVTDECFAAHDSMKLGYRLINYIDLGTCRLRPKPKDPPRNRGQLRLLQLGRDDAASPLSIAEPAWQRWNSLAARRAYARNIGWWDEACCPIQVVAIPQLERASSTMANRPASAE